MYSNYYFPPIIKYGRKIIHLTREFFYGCLPAKSNISQIRPKGGFLRKKICKGGAFAVDYVSNDINFLKCVFLP